MEKVKMTLDEIKSGEKRIVFQNDVPFSTRLGIARQILEHAMIIEPTGFAFITIYEKYEIARAILSHTSNFDMSDYDDIDKIVELVDYYASKDYSTTYDYLMGKWHGGSILDVYNDLREIMFARNKYLHSTDYQLQRIAEMIEAGTSIPDTDKLAENFLDVYDAFQNSKNKKEQNDSFVGVDGKVINFTKKPDEE